MVSRLQVRIRSICRNTCIPVNLRYREREERLEALEYLGHWVGDVDQPLHVSFQDDRGGNDLGVSGGVCS
jgi:S1/P1 Nuclease